MPFRAFQYWVVQSLRSIPLTWRIVAAALAWAVIITLLHFRLNIYTGERQVVHMGYMPVITNLACPLLDQATREGHGIRFHAIKFASFAEMAESLRNDDIQVAFIIAPLSIVLRQQGEDVKVIYIGNRHESTLVADKDFGIDSFQQLAGKTVAVPMRYSGHNLSMLQLIEKHGMEGQIDVVEMNPPDMASALAVGSLDSYYVGEPFAAQTVKSGDSNVVFYVEKVWPSFICNLVLVRADFIEKSPETVQLLVSGAARSGIWAKNNTDQAAQIAARYWNQPVELVKFALNVPPNRIVFDQFTPRQDELQYMADLMYHFGLTDSTNMEGLVEDRFAKNVSMENITDLKSILALP